MKIKTSKLFVLILGAALSGLGASHVAVGDSHTTVMTGKAQAATTPSKALEILEQGNLRFVSGKAMHRDYLEQVRQTADGQFPFAAVVSCLDSRIPPEIVFDQGVGDLFVARVAGNFVNDDILGSLEFATRLAGWPQVSLTSP